jgi:uncharacterized protein (DUF2461 family)
MIPEEIEVPEAVKQRFQNTQRANVRLEAAAEAASFIKSTKSWTADELHTLLGFLQQDWYDGKRRRNRFSPGLVGQHEMWLVEAISKVGAWLGAVRNAATGSVTDDVVRQLLEQYWNAGIKNPFVFPTAVLSVFAPERYIVLTKPTAAAMNRLHVGASYRRSKDPDEYLRLCDAVRAICEPEGWPMCLADAALHLTVGETNKPLEPGKSNEFTGYNAETVGFLRELAKHTEDPAWHQKNKDRYHKLLRDPTLALCREIGSRYLAELDQDVAASKRPTSILKKNDFGGDTYYSHYWFAFFDPAAKRKTESVQLFAIYSGSKEFVRYGVGVGHYGHVYQDNLLKALRTQPTEFADYLDTLPDSLRVRLQYKGRDDEIRELGDLVRALREDALDEFLEDEGKLQSVDVERHFDSLSRLEVRGTKLVDDIGSTFKVLWPLFQAARIGSFGAKVAPPHPAVDDELDIVDEEAPDSLADLSIVTSLSESQLEEIEDALLSKGQIVLSGPPGTSKTYVAEQFARYFVRYQAGGRPQGGYQVVYMHATWGYEDFFEGVRPKLGVSGLEFAPHRGAVLTWIEDTVKKGRPQARYVLVLDEINRCETAAVLGELLQLMEYRGQPTQLLSGRTFSLPRNLYIIGTMNSADRSIGRMDLALRRRFLFLELFPDADVLQTWLNAIDGRNPCGFSADALRQCNDWLQKNHGVAKEQQIGHALFMPSGGHGDGDETEGALTPETIRRIVKYSVLPYVRELLLERGRDPEQAKDQIESFFAQYWVTDAEDDD